MRGFGMDIAILLFLAGCSPLLFGLSEPESAEKDLPSGFQQMLARGTLESIDNPQFVSAEEAEIPPDAWILGVLLQGEARAYSLSLLNSHEVVNDEIAGQPVAAVW